MYLGKGRTNLIRGISRQIIEVQKLGNEYFERALFFVNPVFSDAERSVLEKEARRILREMGGPGRTAARRKRTYLLLRMAASALVGAALAAGGVMVFIR